MNQNKDNENINLIRGDYKKAIKTISTPLIITLVLTMLYNIVDRIWVAGLGSDALAAVGFVTPLFLMINGIATGFGAGSNSLMSRYIGADDKNNVDNSAWHGILMAVTLSILTPLILLPLLDDILILMGAGSVMQYAKPYATVIIVGSFAIIFNGILSNQLRAEGDVKRATIALVATGIINIVLDPIFIYTLGLGVKGAAIATILSACVATGLMLYWMFIKRDTYVNLSCDRFHFSTHITKNIISVAIPGSIEQIIMSVLNMIMNAILVSISSTAVVASFTAAFSIVDLCMMTTVGIATASVTVAGVAYGAGNYQKVKNTYYYATKLSIAISIVILILLMIFTPQIATLFSYSSNSAGLNSIIVEILRILSLFLIVLPPGMCAAMIFQGMGKGLISLVLTLIEQVVFNLLLIILFVYVFNLGVDGVCYSLGLGSLIGSIIAVIIFEWYMERLIKSKGN